MIETIVLVTTGPFYVMAVAIAGFVCVQLVRSHTDSAEQTKIREQVHA